MIGNSRLRPGPRSQALRHRLPAAAALLGLVLVTAGGAEAAAAAGRHHPAAPAVSRSLAAEIRHDEAFVAAKNHHCPFVASHRCPFAAASTPDGSGGHLIAINLRWFTMDACDRGVVYFFDRTRFLGTTRKLRPFSVGGVKSVHAAGAREFSVTYWVNRSRSTICAQSGNGGTDVYKYRWNGSHMRRVSGTPPMLPKVIVGT